MSWSATDLPTLTGVYTRFEDRVTTTPQGGPRGIVAIGIKEYAGTAEEGKLYEVERISQAAELFGSEHIDSIRLIFEHGASKVLAYALPEGADSDDYADMFDLLMTADFNVLVLDQVTDSAIQTRAALAVEMGRAEDNHFIAVLGGSAEDDEDVTAGNERSESFEDDYIVNLINGVVRGEDELSSGEFAPGLAGLIAGNPANETVTYKNENADDVSKRLRKRDRKSTRLNSSHVAISYAVFCLKTTHKNYHIT